MKTFFKFCLLGLGLSTANNLSAQQSPEEELIAISVPIKDCLPYINRLTPIIYEFKSSSIKERHLPAGFQTGFTSEDLKTLLPELVSQQTVMIPSGKNNFKAITRDVVDMEKLIPFLVRGLQEQQLEINELKKKLGVPPENLSQL